MILVYRIPPKLPLSAIGQSLNEKKHAAGGAAPPSMALGSTTCGFTRRVGALGGVGDVVVQAAWEVG